MKPVSDEIFASNVEKNVRGRFEAAFPNAAVDTRVDKVSDYFQVNVFLNVPTQVISPTEHDSARMLAAQISDEYAENGESVFVYASFWIAQGFLPAA